MSNDIDRMKRDYIRVAPTSEHHADRDVPRAIATLHSIWADQSVSFFDRLVPTRSGKREPINFTFYILSVGEDEPVEMYYHVDKEEHMSTLKARLESIYPSTFSIEEVYRDITGRLIEPIEYPRDEYLDKLDAEELFYDVLDDNMMDMTRRIPDNRGPLDLEGPNPHRLPRDPVDTEMLNENSRFLAGERVDVRINRLERVPNEQPLNILRRPTVASLTDPPSDVATDGGEGIPNAAPPGSRTTNSSYLGEAGQKVVDSVYARPPIDQLTPVGVRWKASETEPGDYMTSLTRFDDSVYTSASADETEAHKGEPPLTTILEYITQASQPLALQIRFSPMEPWTEEFQDRQDELQQVDSSSDSLLYQFLTEWTKGNTNQQYPEEQVYHDEPAPHEPIDPPEGSHDEARLEMMKEKQDGRSFIVNMAAISILGPDQNTPSPELDNTLTRLETAFQAFDGDEYEVVGERIGRGFRGEKERKKAIENFEQHLIAVDDPNFWKFWSDDTVRKDFVLDPHELANFIVIPHTDHLSATATRGIRAQQQSQSPLPRPHSGVMRDLRGALEVGHALDQEGKPETKPVGIPVSTLTKHYVRFAATGGGKSIAAETDQLSLSRNTSGPIFNIDAKGGGYLKDYMRAYQAEFGKEALEEDILYFDFPDELPGISFFDIREAYTEADNDGNPDRKDAVQDVADHFVEIIKVVFGRQRFEEAKTAGSLIRYLVKLLFDKEHGDNHGYNRESADVFSYRDLEWLISRIEEVAVSGDYHRLPQTDTGQIEARIHKRLANNADSFLNSLEGVKSRLDEVFQDPRLREVFNNTSPELDFREILDTDKQVLFDLGDLREKSAETVTAVLMMTLFDTLKNRDLSDKPEDYLVNLQVDEAAKVVVSKPMRQFLKEGREFRLCLGLMTQFSKQMEYEGTRGVYMNVLNNVRTTLASTITMDEELAESFAHEDMEAIESKHRLRGMASGEWMIKTINPEWGGAQPQPFNIRAKDIPAGHPEGDEPLSPEDEADFQEIVTRIRQRAAEEYGVVDNQEVTSFTVPPAVQQLLDCPERIGVVLATAVGGAQADEGTGMDVRDANELVRANTVREKVRAYYDEAATRAAASDDPDRAGMRVEHQLPSHESVVKTAQNRTDLIEVEDGNSVNETRLRLTDAGEEAIATDTGDVRSAGGEGHDDALRAISRALAPESFTVNVLEQDGSEMPDARAFHSDLSEPLVLEAETTTPDNPRKVLTNLRKAQESIGVPVFVVTSGNDVADDESPKGQTYWAERVEGILSPPVKEVDDDTGAVEFYPGNDLLHPNGNVTALRPSTTGKRRTRWLREDGELALRDEADTEHARLSNMDEASPLKFPAVDRYDKTNNEHVVMKKRGGEETYTDTEQFKSDWVPVKSPLVPDTELPHPEFDRDDYELIIISTDEGEPPVVYRDGSTYPVSKLLDDPTESPGEIPNSFERPDSNESTLFEDGSLLDNPTGEDGSEPTDETVDEETSNKSGTEINDSVSDESNAKETSDEELGGKDEGVAAFAANRLVQSGDSITPITAIYPVYEEYATENRFKHRRKNQFSRSLKKALDYEIETDRVEIEGSSTARYHGVALLPE
jgi:hypothetical protein